MPLLIVAMNERQLGPERLGSEIHTRHGHISAMNVVARGAWQLKMTPDPVLLETRLEARMEHLRRVNQLNEKWE